VTALLSAFMGFVDMGFSRIVGMILK